MSSEAQEFLLISWFIIAPAALGFMLGYGQRVGKDTLLSNAEKNIAISWAVPFALFGVLMGEIACQQLTRVGMF